MVAGEAIEDAQEEMEGAIEEAVYNLAVSDCKFKKRGNFGWTQWFRLIVVADK